MIDRRSCGTVEAPTFDSNHLYYSHVLTISDWQILQSSLRSPVSELTLAVGRQTAETRSWTTDHFDVHHHRDAYVWSFTRPPCMQMNYALRRCLVKVGRRRICGKLDEQTPSWIRVKEIFSFDKFNKFVLFSSLWYKYITIYIIDKLFLIAISFFLFFLENYVLTEILHYLKQTVILTF